MYNTCSIHPYSHTDDGGRHARQPTAHQEQFGVQYLAQGDFDMQLVGAGIQTGDLPITRRPALPTAFHE